MSQYPAGPTHVKHGSYREDPGKESELPNAGNENDDNGFGWWLTTSRDAYETSEDWFEAAVRKDLERNISHFQNRHASGSKYYSDSFKHRSKSFRPKTRTVVRRNMALVAGAFFGTHKMVDIMPQNSTDLVDAVSAQINQKLLEYRLENTIPWFETLLGAFQDAMVSGPVISHQYWRYEEQVQMVPAYDESDQAILDQNGEQAYDEEVTPIWDTPWVELRPLENIRFSPAANWVDPLGTSPYLIDRIPMTIEEVMSMVEDGGKSNIPWLEDIKPSMLQKGRTGDKTDGAARRQRQRQNIDPAEDQTYLTSDYNTVWVHRNILRKEGRDYIFYTLGTIEMLSEPIPLEWEYPHLKPGQRPYTMGFVELETHKTYPQSPTGIFSGLQQAANELDNQRKDNVSLVLNRRWHVKRGQGVDLKALQRNAPGGVVLMNNPDTDIREVAPPDVTSSSYQEQDRINADFDDVSGNFSPGSVGTNRQLNETVGGMEMISGESDLVTEYQLRMFAKTWVTPVLKQLIQLEQRHESDEAILSLISKQLDLWNRFGVSEIMDDMIQGAMKIEVNVGYGATSPTQKVNRLANGLQLAMQFAPETMSRLNEEEVLREIFGASGYSDSTRFFTPDDPEAPPQKPQIDPQVQLEQVRHETKMIEMEKQFEFDSELEMMRSKNGIRKDEVKYEKDLRDEDRDMAKHENQLAQQLAYKNMDAQTKDRSERVQLAIATMQERSNNRRFQEEMKVKKSQGSGI